jgi:hypothetical protein
MGDVEEPVGAAHLGQLVGFYLDAHSRDLRHLFEDEI